VVSKYIDPTFYYNFIAMVRNILTTNTSWYVLSSDTNSETIYYMRRQLKIQGNFIKHLILHFVISASVYAIIIKSGSSLTYLEAIMYHL